MVFQLGVKLAKNCRNILAGFQELLYPPSTHCPLCRQEDTKGELFCVKCTFLLESWQEEPSCLRCGRRQPETVRLCPSCLEELPPFRLARAVAPYDGYFRLAIQRFKFRGETWLAEPLGQAMAELVMNEPLFAGVELVVPVPLHGSKLKARGFNQSSLLGAEISRRLELPLGEKALRKQWETRDQVGLTREQRLTNLKGAFVVDRPGTVQGKSVLLVDDIFTTGSTVTESTNGLLAGGAAEVFVLTWAAGAG